MHIADMIFTRAHAGRSGSGKQKTTNKQKNNGKKQRAV